MNTELSDVSLSPSCLLHFSGVDGHVADPSQRRPQGAGMRCSPQLLFQRSDSRFVRRKSVDVPQVLQAAERAARIKSDRWSPALMNNMLPFTLRFCIVIAS
jgi:hypothetical protein